jgi:hypothetical protein
MIARGFGFFVGVGTDEIEVKLVGVSLGEEIAAAGEVFQIEELVFFEAVEGFDVALIGVSGGRDADVLALTESRGKCPLNSPPSSVCQSATCKAAENDCLERRNSIRPCVPSHVAYKAERGGNEPVLEPLDNVSTLARATPKP